MRFESHFFMLYHSRIHTLPYPASHSQEGEVFGGEFFGAGVRRRFYFCF